MNSTDNTCVVNCKVQYIRPEYNNLQEWCNDTNNIYIGRKGIVFIEENGIKQRFPKNNSVLCNPYKINNIQDRENVIKKYKEYFYNRINNNDEEFITELKKCKGKKLGCWCVENKQNIILPENKMVCNGEIIMEYLQKL